MTDAPASRSITILGSTGSIGKSALAVVRHYPGRFRVHALAGHRNVAELAAQAREFGPAMVSVADDAAAEALRGLGCDCPILVGAAGLEEIAEQPVDVVLCAMVGAVGLLPLLKAIHAGNNVAVANKEPIVMAGSLVMEAARQRDVAVLPVDSEHNAIFQCLHGHKLDDLHRIHLTASGGPFYGRPRASLADVRPEEATKHPTWDMGAKISVDSATLMNKGLEIVEAMWLFGVPEQQIDVVIHPQSIIHSLVEFKDGHILAHLGVTDMKFPILFALTWPERVSHAMARLDLTTMRELTFAAPDFAAFPCLALARAAAAEGGTATTILNAANEEAVAAFCQHRLPFLRISDIIADVRDTIPATQSHSLDNILEADRLARAKAQERINAQR